MPPSAALVASPEKAAATGFISSSLVCRKSQLQRRRLALRSSVLAAFPFSHGHGVPRGQASPSSPSRSPRRAAAPSQVREESPPAGKYEAHGNAKRRMPTCWHGAVWISCHGLPSLAGQEARLPASAPVTASF